MADQRFYNGGMYSCKNPETGMFYAGTFDDPNRCDISGVIVGDADTVHRMHNVPHYPPQPENTHDHRHHFTADHRTQKANLLLSQHASNAPHRDNLRARCMDIITSGKFSDQDRDIALIALEALTK